MFLTRISVNQPVFATMIMVALMVFGIYSFQRLPIEQLPDVDFPVVAVVVSYPGASPEAVENDVIEPIEESVNTISGIDTINSTARSGEALVILQFEMNIDSATAIQDVRDKIIQNNSVGYNVHRFEEIGQKNGIDMRLATDWEPYEISMVPMGADSGARTRSTKDVATQPCVIVRAFGRTDDDRHRDYRYRIAQAF